MTGVRLGELLIDQGILRPEQVEHVLSVQQRVGRPFGDLAERLFGVDPKAVENAWLEQYSGMLESIDLNAIDPDPRCLKRLNRRQAWQFHVLPIGFEDGELQVVTCRPFLKRAINFAAYIFNEPSVLLLADEASLRLRLMKHYPVPDFLAELATKR